MATFRAVAEQLPSTGTARGQCSPTCRTSGTRRKPGDLRAYARGPCSPPMICRTVAVRRSSGDAGSAARCRAPCLRGSAFAKPHPPRTFPATTVVEVGRSGLRYLLRTFHLLCGDSVLVRLTRLTALTESIRAVSLAKIKK